MNVEITRFLNLARIFAQNSLVSYINQVRIGSYINQAGLGLSWLVYNSLARLQTKLSRARPYLSSALFVNNPTWMWGDNESFITKHMGKVVWFQVTKMWGDNKTLKNYMGVKF